MRYFISGCEPSGDLLAADLVQAIARKRSDARPFGIAGPAMRAAGVEPVARMEDLMVMGFVEVLKHLARIKGIESTVLEAVRREEPVLAVLVDYPGFHLRLAEDLRRMGVKVCQYVAPQLWAWGKKRVVRLAAVTDIVCGIMPFEEEFFRESGVNFHYVGTPQVDRAAKAQGLIPALSDRKRVIGFFPGSRTSEVQRIAPALARIRAALRKMDPHLTYAVSVAPHLDVGPFAPLLGEGEVDGLRAALSKDTVAWRKDTLFMRGGSLELMKRVDAALVTSGTATLECALCATPMAVIYVTSPMTYALAKRVVTLPNISLVNLVAGKRLVEEFVQNIDVGRAASELLELASPGQRRETMRRELSSLVAQLKGEPHEQAASILVGAISP